MVGVASDASGNQPTRPRSVPATGPAKTTTPPSGRRPTPARPRAHGEDAHAVTRALRDEIAELEERIDEAEANAATLPRRRRSLLLVTECLRGLLELQLELIEKV